MTKRIFCVILTLFICLSLFAGCAGEKPLPEAEPTPSPDPESIPTPEAVGKAFGFTLSNMPRMDGSTSLVPLAQAAASLLTGETGLPIENLTQFNRTSQSYRNLMWDMCDILIASWPAESVFEELEAEGFEIDMQPIATDALIFVVNENNPVDNLTTEEIIGIYTGEITNWAELGGNDEAILPFQRNSGAGSQALMEKLVMGDIPMMEAPTELMAGSMGELMDYVKSYDNSSNAIGYSVYYYANDMQMAEGLKIISIDGVKPEAESIRAGDYPHLSNYYTVIAADATADSSQRIMFEWLQGAEGQRLVETQGYVPVMELGDAPAKEATPGGYVVETHWDALGMEEPPEAKFTRLREETISALEAGEDYGALYPFVGRINYDEYGSERHIYGLFDANGRIVCDPVYTDVDALSYYDRAVYRRLPMLGLESVRDGEAVYTLASLDGSFVSPESYGHISCYDFGVLCAESYDSRDFRIFDFDGNVLMSSSDLKLGGLRLERPSDIFGGRGGYLLAWLSDGNGSTAYLINPEGEVVMGGWYSAEFSGDGAIIVYDSGNGSDTGIMNLEGQWIVPPSYDYIEELPGGYWGQLYQGGSHIYDLEGNLMAEYEESIQKMGSGYLAQGSYHDLQGRELPFGEDWSSSSYFGLSSPVICRWTEEGATLININAPEESLLIPGGSDGYVEQLMQDSFMGPSSGLEYLMVWDGNPEHSSKLVSWDLKRLYEFENAATGLSTFSALTDGFTGEEYIRVFNKDSGPDLYNKDMDRVAAAGEWTDIWKGCLSKTDDRFCRYWNEKGELMFCYPLSHGGGD